MLVFTDLSSNGFGFADAYKVTKEMNAEEFIISGRLTFEPKFDKTVEIVAAWLLETETSLDKLQRIMNKMSKKGGKGKCWLCCGLSVGVSEPAGLPD